MWMVSWGEGWGRPRPPLNGQLYLQSDVGGVVITAGGGVNSVMSNKRFVMFVSAWEPIKTLFTLTACVCVCVSRGREKETTTQQKSKKCHWWRIKEGTRNEFNSINRTERLINTQQKEAAAAAVLFLVVSQDKNSHAGTQQELRWSYFLKKTNNTMQI